MQTPLALAEANKSKAVKQKVVERAMCSLLTKGTIVDPDLIGMHLHHNDNNPSDVIRL